MLRWLAVNALLEQSNHFGHLLIYEYTDKRLPNSYKNKLYDIFYCLHENDKDMQ